MAEVESHRSELANPHIRGQDQVRARIDRPLEPFIITEESPKGAPMGSVSLVVQVAALAEGQGPYQNMSGITASKPERMPSACMVPAVEDRWHSGRLARSKGDPARNNDWSWLNSRRMWRSARRRCR